MHHACKEKIRSTLVDVAYAVGEREKEREPRQREDVDHRGGQHQPAKPGLVVRDSPASRPRVGARRDLCRGTHPRFQNGTGLTRFPVVRSKYFTSCSLIANSYDAPGWTWR